MLLTMGVQAQKEIIIEGSVTNVEDGAVLKVSRDEGKTFSTIAVDTIYGGKFSFKIEAER